MNNPVDFIYKIIERACAPYFPANMESFEEARLKLNLRLTAVFLVIGLLYGLTFLPGQNYLLCAFTLTSSLTLLMVPFTILKVKKEWVSYTIYIITGVLFAAFNIYGSGNGSSLAITLWQIFVVHLAFAILSRRAALLFGILVLVMYLVKRKLIEEGISFPYIIAEEIVERPRLIDIVIPSFFNFYLAYTSYKLYAQARKHLEELARFLSDARKKAEESDRLKSAFLANISHEIRTPMNAIVGFTELLERASLEEEKRQFFLNLIRERSKVLLRIVNDILDISRIEAGQISSSHTVGNISQTLNQHYIQVQNEKLHLYGKDFTVKLNNEIENHETNVSADFLKLDQVLTNLLTNATKFTKCGSIELGCRQLDQSTVLFYVCDTGIGIAQEKQDLIFKPFYQAHESIHQEYGGSGLGLAICKGLVEAWGGKMWVESEVGKGSCFYFTMPYNPVT